MKKYIIRAVILPWLIVGGLSAAIVGAAAMNMAQEAATAKERETAVEEELVKFPPPLTVIESDNASEQYPDAP